MYEQTGAARRAAVHRRVAGARGRRDADPAELAHHFLAAGDRTQGRRVLGRQRAPRARPARLRGRRRALRPARSTRSATTTRSVAASLLLALGDAQARAGETPPSKRAYREAAELAERLIAARAARRAAVGYGGRLLWDVSRDDPDRPRCSSAPWPRSASRTARCGSGCSPGSLAGRCATTHDPTRRRAITAEALEAARRLGDAATLACALDGYISAHHSPDHTPRQVELAGELIDASLRAGDIERSIEAYEHRAAARLELGDVAGAAADVDAMAPLAAELRQPPQDWFVAERRAVQALHDGRLADAELLSRRGAADRARGPGLERAGLPPAPARRPAPAAGPPRRDRSRPRARRPRTTRPAIRSAAARTSTSSPRSVARTRRVPGWRRSRLRASAHSSSTRRGSAPSPSWPRPLTRSATRSTRRCSTSASRPTPTAWRSARRNSPWRASRATSACSPPPPDERTPPPRTSRSR